MPDEVSPGDRADYAVRCDPGVLLDPTTALLVADPKSPSTASPAERLAFSASWS